MPERTVLPAALAILAATPALLRSLLASMPPATAEAPVDDGWCVKDVVAHLLDADGVDAERIRRILSEDRPFIRSIDPTARLAEHGYTERSLSSLLDDLERRRSDDIAWLRSLPDGDLQRAGEHDRAGEISVANIVHDWAYHDLMHLQQIARMLQSGLLDELGNTRRFFEDV